VVDRKKSDRFISYNAPVVARLTHSMRNQGEGGTRRTSADQTSYIGRSRDDAALIQAVRMVTWPPKR